jgi:FkbM family methyltransferase
MSKLLRETARFFFHLYPLERGKYKIIEDVYFKYLAPKEKTRKISRIFHNIIMDLDLTEYVQANLYLYGTYEKPTLKFISKLLKEGDTTIDVGANVGLMSLIFAKCIGNSGKVFSFEPEPNNNAALLNNIKLNSFSNISVSNSALSNKKGVLKFYLSNDNNSGTHSLYYNSEKLSTDFIEVQALPFDEFIVGKNISDIKLIKIDVEGAEIDVIEGMKMTLQSLKPVLILEVVEKYLNQRESSSSEFKKYMLNKMNYEPYKLLNSGYLSAEPLDDICPGDNIVFIHKGRVADFRYLIK